MNDEEHACVLRTLTLCDGESAPQLGPRAREQTACYCAQLAECLANDWQALASAVRTERARVIAQGEELRRVRDRHRRLTTDVDW